MERQAEDHGRARNELIERISKLETQTTLLQEENARLKTSQISLRSAKEEMRATLEARITRLEKPRSSFGWLKRRLSFSQTQSEPDILRTFSGSEIEHVTSPSLLCKICFDTEINILLPCGHACTCEECTNRVLKATRACPICRKAFKKKGVKKIILS